MLVVCYKLPYMDGLYKLDSGHEFHFPVKGSTLKNDIRTHQIFHIIYIFLVLECDWESVDNVVTCYKMDGQGFKPQ